MFSEFLEGSGQGSLGSAVGAGQQAGQPGTPLGGSPRNWQRDSSTWGRGRHGRRTPTASHRSTCSKLS